MKLSILDIGFGNLSSLKNAFSFLGIENRIINQVSEIENSESIILPGDGSFKAIKTVYEKNYFKPLCDHVNKKRPLLGICLGMQFFANLSNEDSTNKGFGWIPGEVIKFKSSEKLQVPHIGYNSIEHEFNHTILENIKNNSDFYFIHSFFYLPKSSKHTLAKTEYGQKFSSIIVKDNILGVQFHPEKSQQNGLLFLKNFHTFSKKTYHD